MKTDELRLEVPAPRHREEALRFRRAFFEAGEDTIDGSSLLDRTESYDEWLRLIGDAAAGKGGPVTEVWFACDGSGKLVGILDLRHELNDFFRDLGHCGYSVLPDERRQGYATRMLHLATEKARQAGMRELQLSVLRINTPSVRTILKNGGVYTRSFNFYGEPADVYRICLDGEDR